MIFKFLLLLSLLSLVTAFILKKALVKPAKIKGVDAQIDTESLIKKLSHHEVVKGNGKSLTFKNGEAHIPTPLAESRSIEEQAAVTESIGLAQLAKDDNLWQKRLKSMIIFDQIALPFAILITVFGVLAKTLNINVASYILLGCLLLNCLNNFYMTWVRHLAMKLIRPRLETISLYTKDEDRGAVEHYIKSYAYRNLMPISLKWIG